MGLQLSKLATLLGTASIFAIVSAQRSQAQSTDQLPTMNVAAEAVPEQVLVTGSLIRGTVAVGVPVTNLGNRDLVETGALTTSDLFRTVPAANVDPGPLATNSPAGNIERGTKVNIRGEDGANAPRALLMVDGVRIPPQGDSLCGIDPSIIPALALDRVDILIDGASATYGSDAVAGVVNIILKRGYDGAITQLRYSAAPKTGYNGYQASQLWGRTWDGGDLTLSYEWSDNTPGYAKNVSNLTNNYTPWGLNNLTPIASSTPGTISVGKLSPTTGTVCSNCYAIPAGTGSAFNPINGGLGPLTPFSASTLNWALFGVAANAGTTNEFNPNSTAWYSAAEQRNGGTLTVDQRLTPDISFYGEGFYSDRRSQFLNGGTMLPTALNATTVPVPTSNPYYPTNAPSNLQVSYNFSSEMPGVTSAYEIADRYLGGLNIALPHGWEGQTYFSETYDSNAFSVSNDLNPNAVSAALGWTIAATPTSGTTPGIAAWTKPATIPYLNLFCDPRAYACNSPATENYISAPDETVEKFWIHETNAKFDGPLFDLPGGQVKAAVGADYMTENFYYTNYNGTAAPTLLAPTTVVSGIRSVWAAFAQLNVPVFGDANKIPGFARLDLEASWRHDQYSDFGGTNNPKFGFTWLVSEELGATLRGSWGTSFRAPGFADSSAIGINIFGFNLPSSIYSNPTVVGINCNSSGQVAAGSGAAKLFNAGFACGSTPGGLSVNNYAAAKAAGWRSLVNQSGQTLRPEVATNMSAGFDIAPTIPLLKGFDFQATWYQIKINDVLSGVAGTTNVGSFNNGAVGFTFITPSDVGCPVSNNLNPSACVPFEKMVAAMLQNPSNPVPLQGQTLIYWLSDAGDFNSGWDKLSGIDWAASYDHDFGNFGAWDTGITGTYYLHHLLLVTPGAAGAAGVPVDRFNTNLLTLGGVAQNGVETQPRMHYRARLGWSDGEFSVTGYVNYVSHFFNTQSAPPNVNFQCTSAGGAIGGGTFPCAISNYTDIEPSQYLFDLSLGYDTGDRPANSYLQRLHVQIVVQDLLDTGPAFEYRISKGGGGAPAAYDVTKSAQGRTISLTVTKTW
jgi:iron complex outermembrane receptor protein